MIDREQHYHDTAIESSHLALKHLETLLEHLDNMMYGVKDIDTTINDIRHELKVVQDAVRREGRIAGWGPAGSPRLAPWNQEINREH